MIDRLDQVQRFTFGSVAGEKSDSGQWIDYDDYVVLRQQFAELEQDHARLLEGELAT